MHLPGVVCKAEPGKTKKDYQSEDFLLVCYHQGGKHELEAPH